MKRSILAVFALVVGLLVPATPAASVDFVKTITVTRSDGAAYAGAQVALIGWENSRHIISPLATANASGVATVTADSTLDFYAFGVVPPAGDFTHATFVEYGSLNATNQSLSAQLVEANFVVALKHDDGSYANPGSWINFPATGDYSDMLSQVPVLRSGPFAIDLSSDLTVGDDYKISIEPNARPGAFGTDFGLRVAAKGTPDTYSVFTDTT